MFGCFGKKSSKKTKSTELGVMQPVDYYSQKPGHGNQNYTTGIFLEQPAGQHQAYGGLVNHVFVAQPFREDYHKKKIENAGVKRTEVIGTIDAAITEFDDYFEKHVEKFFTLETQEIDVYHYQGYIFGIQSTYRDTWGKNSKESYKAKLHMATNVDKNGCQCEKLVFGFGEFVKEILVETAGENISFLKIRTNMDHVLEIGTQVNPGLKNVVPEQGRMLAIGGTFGACLNSIYFYYS